MTLSIVPPIIHNVRRLQANKWSSIWTTAFDHDDMATMKSALCMNETAYEIAKRYRLEYYLRIPPREALPAWDGACWCSDVAIGGFPYGPGPGDPYLPATLIQAFFSYHERGLELRSPVSRRLPREAEDDLNRRCYVLALFELIVRIGLDESHESPLFGANCHRVPHLLNLVNADTLASLRGDSLVFYRSKFEIQREWAHAEEDRGVASLVWKSGRSHNCGYVA